MATLIKSSGEETPMKDVTLDSLQKAVEGYIECIYFEKGRVLVVNEEGQIENLPYNEKASKLSPHRIVGNAVLCEKGEFK